MAHSSFSGEGFKREARQNYSPPLLNSLEESLCVAKSATKTDNPVFWSIEIVFWIERDVGFGISTEKNGKTLAERRA